MELKLTPRFLQNGQRFFGPGVAELLERVREHRSLRAAAASMEMAYSKAWRIIHEAEEEMCIRDRAYTAAMRPLTEELDMAQPAVDILLFLANNPGMDTARDICTYRHLKPAIVSFHVEKLAGEGYLERQPVPGDRRKCRLVCTEKAGPVDVYKRQATLRTTAATLTRKTAG